MKIKFDRYKNGTKRVLTFSYDDGHIHDRRLVDVFNKYGMHGTFHLNSRWHLDRGDWVVSPDEIKTLYAGHEVSCHMPTHDFVTRIPRSALAAEIMTDRRNLEQMCGYVVRGMSYPCGSFSDQTDDILRTCGIEYARTTRSTEWFAPPDNPLQWHPTCHHNNPRLHELFDRFSTGDTTYAPLQVMFVWGHSFEFNRNDSWQVIEEFCKHASGKDGVWYATNIEICDYLNALRGLRVSADGTMIHNPSATDVWVSADDEPIKISAGTTVTF